MIQSNPHLCKQQSIYKLYAKYAKHPSTQIYLGIYYIVVLLRSSNRVRLNCEHLWNYNLKKWIIILFYEIFYYISICNYNNVWSSNMSLHIREESLLVLCQWGQLWCDVCITGCSPDIGHCASVSVPKRCQCFCPQVHVDWWHHNSLGVPGNTWLSGTGIYLSAWLECKHFSQ